MTEDERDSLNVRDFAEQYRLQAEGVNFFRQVWDRSVTSIYKDVLSELSPPSLYLMLFLCRRSLLDLLLSVYVGKNRLLILRIAFTEIDEPKYGRAPKFNSYVDQDGKRPPKYSLQ